jgi:CRISPR-associated protein Csm2
MSYYDNDGNIRVELLDTEASDQAGRFIVQSHDRRSKKKPLSSAQLRKFFGEFKQLEKKVDSEGFNKVKPLIKMVKSKAAYASNPSNQKIPPAFKNFLINNIDSINEEKDFRAFMLHFEAVVGFFYGIEGVKSN